MSAQENTPDLVKSEEPQRDTYKKQLDRVADEARSQSWEQKPNPVVEKSMSCISTLAFRMIDTDMPKTVTEYVPAAAKIFGQSDKPEPAARPDPSIPPNRPDHDHKIEDFVRDQHRSKGEDGLLEDEGK